MYRERIREYYDRLSRSYRRVADFLMSNYYEASFMTAAQLALVVGVDTTTIVRFSQRLGYAGYPDLLHDIREQVKSEIYAAYQPQDLASGDVARIFKDQIKREQQNLTTLMVHNPPEHVAAMVAMLRGARHVLLIADGYATSAAEVAALQLRHRGFIADVADSDSAKLAATLVTLTSDTLVIGVSASAFATGSARALQFARSRGCQLLGVIGSLSCPVNRMADLVIYAPSDGEGATPSIVCLTAALTALVTAAGDNQPDAVAQHLVAFSQAYEFLTMPEAAVPEDDLAQ